MRVCSFFEAKSADQLKDERERYGYAYRDSRTRECAYCNCDEHFHLVIAVSLQGVVMDIREIKPPVRVFRSDVEYRNVGTSTVCETCDEGENSKPFRRPMFDTPYAKRQRTEEPVTANSSTSSSASSSGPQQCEL